MNIFVLDYDPSVCAKMHCDKHVVKMILESAQLLCGVHHMTDSVHEPPYGLSHKNHPCSIWARECIENYLWLCDLGLELCKEYTLRYGKYHKCQRVISWCLEHLPNLRENGDLTPFAMAMPDYCKIGTAVQSYREYYNKEKTSFAKWKFTSVPHWYNSNKLQTA